MRDLGRRDLLVGLGVTALGTACVRLPDCPVCSAADDKKLLDIPNGARLKPERCEVYAFDEVHRATATVYHPGSVEDIELILKTASAEKRRVTPRGGGQALYIQSLNDDIIMSTTDPALSKIGSIQRDTEGYFIQTGAGATWWDVVCAVAPYGLMPPSLVTAGWGTVGGTLASDCVSRMSPIVGKEGRQIRRFHMVSPNGTTGWYGRKDKDDKLDVFRATIGGFGALGVVTSVEFDLMVARSNPGVIDKHPCVMTRSTRHGNSFDWDTILRQLQSKTKTSRERFRVNRRAHLGALPDMAHKAAVGGQDFDEVLAHTPEWSALSIASFVQGATMSANMLEQRYVDPQQLRTLPSDAYVVDSGFPATALGMIEAWPTLGELAVEIGFPEGEFVDELFGWAFFLHNATQPAKMRAHAKNGRINFTQQSFALPSGDEANPDTRPMQRFMELVLARLHEADIRPGNIDFLYIPADEFLMSASNGLNSFVVTVSFIEKNRDAFTPEATDTLRALSHDCRTLGGRVHLVKGVYAERADLRAMYGDAAATLRKLKDIYDPNGVLKNQFFHEVFEA